jgi:hypothetical protein
LDHLNREGCTFGLAHVWPARGKLFYQETKFQPKRQNKMKYYDLKRNWTKNIVPHLSNEDLNATLVRDFNKYTIGNWGTPFKQGMHPRAFETCDWDINHRGKKPAFWRYVKHAACHWLVNFTLKLAMLVLPRRKWRIVTSDEHSTVWDGKDTIFDFNFQAMGITANECYEAATAQGSRELAPGKLLRVYYADPNSRTE